MGRKKIEIKKIDDERIRNVTFQKRKAGLLKKAMELSILCECRIAMVIVSKEGKLFRFCTTESDFDQIINKSLNEKKPVENRTNSDVLKSIEEKKEKEKKKKELKEKKKLESSPFGSFKCGPSNANGTGMDSPSQQNSPQQMSQEMMGDPSMQLQQQMPFIKQEMKPMEQMHMGGQDMNPNGMYQTTTNNGNSLMTTSTTTNLPSLPNLASLSNLSNLGGHHMNQMDDMQASSSSNQYLPHPQHDLSQAPNYNMPPRQQQGPPGGMYNMHPLSSFPHKKRVYSETFYNNNISQQQMQGGPSQSMDDMYMEPPIKKEYPGPGVNVSFLNPMQQPHPQIEQEPLIPHGAPYNSRGAHPPKGGLVESKDEDEDFNFGEEYESLRIDVEPTFKNASNSHSNHNNNNNQQQSSASNSNQNSSNSASANQNNSMLQRPASANGGEMNEKIDSFQNLLTSSKPSPRWKNSNLNLSQFFLSSPNQPDLLSPSISKLFVDTTTPRSES